MEKFILCGRLGETSRAGVFPGARLPDRHRSRQRGANLARFAEMGFDGVFACGAVRGLDREIDEAGAEKEEAANGQPLTQSRSCTIT